MCGLYAGSTPVGGSAYRKHAAGNSIERKRLCRGHQSKVVKCLCWKAELYPYPPPSLSFSIYIFFSCFSFFSLFVNAECGVLSLLFSREIRLTCQGLKGICSAHQVCLTLLFLWTAPPYNAKLKEERIKTYCSVHPLLLLQSGNTGGIQFNNENNPHIWLLDWAGRVDLWWICCFTGFVGQINV